LHYVITLREPFEAALNLQFGPSNCSTPTEVHYKERYPRMFS